MQCCHLQQPLAGSVVCTAYLKSLQHVRRTYSFAIRPRKAKKPWDSNETLQERKVEEKKQETLGREYLGAVKSADGTATPLGSKVGVRGPMVQHE